MREGATFGSAAAPYVNKPWYGLIPVEAVAHRAPIAAPFLVTPDERAEWLAAVDFEQAAVQKREAGGRGRKGKRTKKLSLGECVTATLAQRRAKGYFIYNDHLAAR